MASPKTHRVMHGETLESIAQAYYGDPNMGEFIFQHNAAYIADPNHLYLGQVIIIPHVPFLKRLLGD